MSTPKKQVILIVDDELLNLKLMEAMLDLEGYQVLEAGNGKEALIKAKENPDLILLDIMMPILDGFETCRLLKEDLTTKDIPIIFLSALQDSKSKLTGFNLGGVDYISKPFQREDLLARVRTHLTIREQGIRLREYADRLEEMVEERTRQLVHADRLATLGTLVAAVAHEFNNPLQAIIGNVELALLELDEYKQGLYDSSNEISQGFLSGRSDRVENGLREINRASQKLTEIINNLKNFGKKKTDMKENFYLRRPIQDALAIIRARIKTSTAVEVQVPADLMIQGNYQQFSQIFINLVHNAADALAGKEGKITISAESTKSREVIIDVRDSGQGIPKNLCETIFDPFFTTKDESDGTGLGLFITRQIVEKYGGHIEAVPHDGPGGWFRIILPEVIQPFKSAESAHP